MIESVMELILNAVLVVYLFVGQSEKNSEQLESIPTNQTVISTENTAERKMSKNTSTLTGNSSRAQNKKPTKHQKVKPKKSKLLQ